PLTWGGALFRVGDSSRNPCGILEESTGCPRGCPQGVWRLRAQAVVPSFHRRFRAQGLTCPHACERLWIPRGIPVESSRNPPVVLESVHSVHNCRETVEQLEDERWMDVG